jgi:hypothetical protein
MSSEEQVLYCSDESKLVDKGDEVVDREYSDVPQAAECTEIGTTYNGDENNTTGAATMTSSRSYLKISTSLRKISIDEVQQQVQEELQELKTELTHVAKGNRETWMPNYLSLPIIVAEWLVHPFQVLITYTKRRFQESREEEERVIHTGHYHPAAKEKDTFGE